MNLPPKERTIIPPEGGWKDQRFYAVDVAFDTANIVHRSIFYSGFLHEGKPAGYNTVFNPTYDGTYTIGDLHYLKVIRDLNIDDDENMNEKTETSEKLNRLLKWRDSKISGTLFLSLPDRWFNSPTWACENGHISHHYIKSESFGYNACQACMKPVLLVPPETTEKQLAEILTA